MAGYLVGTVTGPDTPQRTTAEVVSFDSGTEKLCLKGDAIKDQEGVDSDGPALRHPAPRAQLPGPRQG